MNSSALSMELSVSFVSWINDQMKDQIETVKPARKFVDRQSLCRGFIVCGVACISIALGSLLAW